jgi:hypothetical protein
MMVDLEEELLDIITKVRLLDGYQVELEVLVKDFKVEVLGKHITLEVEAELVEMELVGIVFPLVDQVLQIQFLE